MQLKQRHNPCSIRINIESDLVDVNAMNKALYDTTQFIAGHSLRDVYNMSETGKL